MSIITNTNYSLTGSQVTNLATRIKTNASDIDTIEAKIPTAATSSNQLADKAFVNSSVGTNTANYISNNGEPFTSVAQLEAYTGTVTNNDYAFVTGTDSAGNTYYDRYKATISGTTVTWAKEYRLNNSSFTSAQWSAISSGITSALVTKLSGLAEIKSIGANLSLNASGQLSATDTTYNDFAGSAHGLVPASTSSDQDKFLKGNGQWATISEYTLQPATTSTIGGVIVGAGLSVTANGTISADTQAEVISDTDWNALWA